MKKHLIIFFLLITAGANAQEHDTSIFYEISGNGLEKSSYLFGTVHLICEDESEINPAVKAKLFEVEKVVFEIDLSDTKKLNKAAENMDMPNDTTLDMLLTKEQYALVVRYLRDSFGIDSAKYNTYKPIMLIQEISPYLLGCKEVTAMEMALVIPAMFLGKEIDGLEEVEDQTDVLENIPLKDQATGLYDIIKEYEMGKSSVMALVGAYVARDLIAMSNMLSEDDSMTPEAEKALLDDRNKAWIPRMQKMMKKKSCFFAVGAGHLAGETGLLNLLRAAGYTVTPLDEY